MAVGAEADAQETSSSAGSSLFKKKSRGPRLVRKRSTSPSAAVSRSGEGVGSHGVLEASEPEESTSVVQRKKTSAYNPLRQGTGRKRQRVGGEGEGEGEGDEGIWSEDELQSGSDAESSKPAPAHHLDRAGTQSKVQSHAWASAPASTSSAFEYKYAEDEARGAVAVSVDKHYGGDAGQSAKASNADGMYRGKAAYDTYLETRDNGKSSSFNAAAKGPIKATANVRTVTVTDYQPDICKDYKETGYCGFGDTCKFLHDRSDYLAGWQMDSLSNTASRQIEAEESDEEEEIPFACLICRQPFTDPIVTRCGHYFCASCAIKRYAKTPKCFACGAQTQGIFNSATKILHRMERRREAKADEKSHKGNGWSQLGGAPEEAEEEEEDEGGEQLLDGVEIGGGADEYEEEE